MTFAYPYFLLLPLIYLALALRPQAEKSSVTFASRSLFDGLSTSPRVFLRKPLGILFSSLFVCTLSLGLARPQRTIPLPRNFEAHDIMLVIDISGSMSTRDFRAGMSAVSRLDAVKEVVAEFIENRHEDRIGLAVFSATGFLQAPLTLDHNIIIQLLKHLQPGTGGDGTAIGDGLGVALKSLEETRGKTSAIVLLTDGVNNAGTVEPLQAANVAHDLGIKVHTIGIGTSHPEFGIEYDEDTLQNIADKSGGVFFHASNIDGLKRVYTQIDELEKRAQDEAPKLVANELYVNFALAAAALLLGGALLFNTYLLKLP